eukprot:6212527-Pleurochrysis_carterae.AAC.3
MNAVATDVNSTSTPALEDWQADLFGVIPPPVSAHAAWTDDCCDEMDMGTEPTERSAIAGAQLSLGITVMQGIRAAITATQSVFFHLASSFPSRKPDANYPRC